MKKLITALSMLSTLTALAQNVSPIMDSNVKARLLARQAKTKSSGSQPTILGKNGLERFLDSNKAACIKVTGTKPFFSAGYFKKYKTGYECKNYKSYGVKQYRNKDLDGAALDIIRKL